MENILNGTGGPCTNHTFGNWEVIEAATFKKTGKEKRVCTRCGEEEQQEIPVKEVPDGSSLIITPDKNEYKVGDIINFQVTLSTTGEIVDSSDLRWNYTRDSGDCGPLKSEILDYLGNNTFRIDHGWLEELEFNVQLNIPSKYVSGRICGYGPEQVGVCPECLGMDEGIDICGCCGREATEEEPLCTYEVDGGYSCCDDASRCFSEERLVFWYYPCWCCAGTGRQLTYTFRE